MVIKYMRKSMVAETVLQLKLEFIALALIVIRVGSVGSRTKRAENTWGMEQDQASIPLGGSQIQYREVRRWRWMTAWYHNSGFPKVQDCSQYGSAHGRDLRL